MPSAAIVNTPTINRSRGAGPLRGGRTVDAGEVVEDRAALVGRQSAQLLPRRRPELDRRLRVDAAGGRVHLVALRRRGLALSGIVALVLLEGASRVEQPAEELLLPRERGRVEPSVVERVGELARLAGELRRAVAAGAVTRVLELIGDVALLARELPRHRLALATAGALRHPHQSLRLRVDLPLLLRHLAHLLDHLAEARCAVGTIRPL